MNAIKRTSWILGFTTATLGICVCILAWRHSLLLMEARATWADFAEYDRARAHLTEMTIPDLAEYLNIVTRPEVHLRNHDLALIRTHEKRRMIIDLIAELRIKTKTDLGGDPKEWVQRFRYQAQK